MKDLSDFAGQNMPIGQPVGVLVGSPGSGAAPPDALDDSGWVRQGAVTSNQSIPI